MSRALPTWARTEAENFRASGHLSGDNVVKQPVPAGMQGEVEGQLTDREQRFTQSIDEYLTGLHSQNGFSRDRMPASEARTRLPTSIMRMPVRPEMGATTLAYPRMA